MKPTIISLFAGIGGLDLAAHWAGFETVRFVEKEPFCQQVLRKHWPGVPIDDDVFTSHPGYADVVIGGFPCQPFSVAGNRQGKDDERYLLPEMLRIVAEVQPYAVLFENVPGFPSLNDGAEFKYLLRTLAEMGFDAEWGHIRASDIGAPHQRERWFLVAYRTNYGSNWGDRFKTNDAISRRKWVISTRSSIYGGVKTMAYANGINADRWGHDTGQLSQHKTPIILRSEYWKLKSGLGRAANGLPGWLDFVGFPARPSEPQFAYEPPRVVKGAKDRTARIKALGNAVVPQVAYPIFTALMEWFQRMEKEQAA